MLSPYRVLDLTDEKGQLASFLLAQLGAEVIAVEPPGGTNSRHLGPFVDDRPDPERSLRHWAYNRGKLSVTLDGVDLPRLAATADVLIESGAIPVDLAGLRAANPGLVTVSISPFGSTGPKAGWLASDLTVAAASGEMALNGDDDRPPVRISEPQAFHHASLEAAVGAVVALLERRHSGLGQHLDVSAQQSLMQATQVQMLNSALGSPEIQRVAGGARVGPYRLRFVYPAKDGYVSVTFLFGDMIGRFTQRLMAWVHEQGYCSEQLRDLDYISFFELMFSNRLDPALLTQAIEAVAEFTATRTKAELLEVARQRRLLIVPVAGMSDVRAFEQFAAREFWDTVALAMPDGRARSVEFPGPWAHASNRPLLRLGPPPRVGQHDGDAEQLLGRRPSIGAPTSTSPTSTPPTSTPPTSTPPPLGGRALEGLKVLDFTWVIAGPMATRLLADHGATVVRIETEDRPDVIRAAGPFIEGLGGIEDTALWHSIGAGKLSLQLDLSIPEARRVVLDLVRWADVVVDSFSPGVLDGLGLGYETLRQVKPDLVMVSSSLLGQRGPFARFAGFGNLGGALAGFYGITGWPDRLPAGPWMAYTDYVSPRFFALAILAGLDHVRRTGVGQHIDVSQIESTVHLLTPALLDLEVNGREARPMGNDDPRYAPHGVYPAAPEGADRWVAVACTDDGQWERLAKLVGRPDLAGLSCADRLSRRRELDEVVAAWTAGRDPVLAQEELQRAGVAAHQVQNSRECLADEQLAHRKHFRRVPHALHGEVWVEGPHVLYSRTPAGPAAGGPTLGQHTEWVLRELLGYDEDAIADLVVTGALR